MNSTTNKDSRVYSLSTLIAVVRVKTVTFNSWRKRNGLFPRTQQEKGWSYYSLADICAACSVKWMTAQGHTAQFAVDAAMALLPRFEVMDRDARAYQDDQPLSEAVVNTVAIIMNDDDGEDSKDAEIYIEFYPPTAMLQDVLKTADNRNRIGWGNATFFDMFDVYKTVLAELQELRPEIIASPMQVERMTAEVLLQELQASLDRDASKED